MTATAADLEIIYRDPTDLRPYERNARKHPPSQIAKIRASIREFGFRNPVLLRDDDETIGAGHGRVEAAIEEGLDRIPTITLHGLTDAQWRAYVIADNRIALDGGWDLDALKSEMQDLRNEGFDLDLTGFDLSEVAGMFANTGAGRDPDRIPEVPKVAVSRLGDVWVLGNHRLLCGDSCNPLDVARLMDGRKADLVLTDPPYNVDYGHVKHPKFRVREIQNDNMTTDAFRVFCQQFAQNIRDHATGCIYVWGPPGPDGRVMFTVLDALFHCSTTIVWAKDRFILGRGKYHNRYEPCWFGWNGDGARFSKRRDLDNVWEVDRPASSDLHPTMKPVALFERAVDHASKAGDVVLDLFSGSGTTLVVAEKTGRAARVMELDPVYADVSVRRWEEFAGALARLESTGQTLAEVEAERLAPV